MKICKLHINDLTPYEKNAKIHTPEQIEQIKASIKQFGMNDPIGVWGDKNIIVEGHGRLMALKEMGYEEVDCIRLDHLSDDERKAYTLAHNKLTLNTDFDFDTLQAELDAIELDMTEFGFEEFEAEIVVTEQDDVVPEVPDEPKAKLGDVYQLGEHRLMCGDSTDKEAVAKLMDGNKASVSFTSPPYNVGHNIGYDDKDSKYANDDDNKQDYLSFLLDFTNNAMRFSEYTFVNIQQLANNKIDLINYLNKFKLKLADTIVWDKGHGTPALAHKVLTSCFEFIYVFSEKATRAIGTKDFHGTVSNIVRIPPQRNNEYSDIHNATFPIELPQEIIDNFTNKNDSILDLFGGTGTTLIACEKLNRKCFMMELDPKYVDVIIQRWEDFTGKQAVKM